MSQKSPRIGLICGSLRKGSINQTFQTALKSKLDAAGAQTTELSLGDYDLPLYHGDLDTPEGVGRLIADMKSFDGIVITTPEYNGSLPPLLKNAIDWTSTVETGHIKGPVYGIASCTPGPMSGIMCLRQLQFILLRLGANLVPNQVGCGNAAHSFDAEGNLVNERVSSMADDMIGALMDRIHAKP